MAINVLGSRVSGITEWVETPLRADAEGVWANPDATPLAYSDGGEVERYLEKVLREARDLGSASAELTSRIKDWPSEYHLSPKRAQLLRGFAFDPSAKVLEVGSGCGAITRYLGETFDHVLAVEGSPVRARIGRLRTRDQPHVEVVQGALQDLRFATTFDLIVCIGVFEYASMFAGGRAGEGDPHTAMLRDLAGLLAPDGVLVLAIENKLGLKYFSTSSEDHTGVMFDGIEGYPRYERKARTFGRQELLDRLGAQFGQVKLYYPFPDYKVPSCVLTEEMLTRFDASELVGSFPSVDHGDRRRRPLFDEALAWKELAANGLIPAMANSFLAFASRSHGTTTPPFDGLGRLYSNARRPVFSTLTRFEDAGGGAMQVTKSRTAGGSEFVEGSLRHREWSGPWHSGTSLHYVMARRMRSRDLDLTGMLEPSRIWFDDLQRTVVDGEVPGDRLDTNWRNCYIAGEACDYIDQEWEWTKPLPLRLVVARVLFDFAVTLLDMPSLSPLIQRWRVDEFLAAAAACYGVELDQEALQEFTDFEAAFLTQVTGRQVAANDVAAVLRRRLKPRGAQVLSGLPRRGIRWMSRRVSRR